MRRHPRGDLRLQPLVGDLPTPGNRDNKIGGGGKRSPAAVQTTYDIDFLVARAAVARGGSCPPDLPAVSTTTIESAGSGATLDAGRPGPQ